MNVAFGVDKDRKYTYIFWDIFHYIRNCNHGS